MQYKIRSRKNNQLRSKIKPWLFLAPAIILFALVILFPVIKVFDYSFHENLFDSDNPAFIGFDNYKAVFGDSRFSQMIQFTGIFTIGSTLLHICFGILFSVMLNKNINRHALSFFRVIFILPWVFTAAVVAVVWQLMLNAQGVVNVILSQIIGNNVILIWLGQPTLAVISLLIINGWRGYPTCMVSFLAGLQNIPDSLYEAARVDGANKVRQFFSITLPSLKPIILSVGLLDAIWTMNLFPLIWLTTGGGPLGKTESIATLTYRMSFTEFEFGRASALAVIGLVITFLGIMVYMRYQKSMD